MGEPIVEWLNQQQDNMVELLRDLVDIDSNSFDKAGVDLVGARLTAFFDDNEIPHETIPLEEYGDAIRAVVSGGDGNQPILLCGHRDTVFPTGEVKKRPFSIADGKAFGPGVAFVIKPAACWEVVTCKVYVIRCLISAVIVSEAVGTACFKRGT